MIKPQSLIAQIISVAFFGLVAGSAFVIGPVWCAMIFLFISVAIAFDKAKRAEDRANKLAQDIAAIRGKNAVNTANNAGNAIKNAQKNV